MSEESTHDAIVMNSNKVEEHGRNDTGSVSCFSAEAGNKIFIGNLSYKMTENDLRELFEGVGVIEAISIPSRRSYKSGTYRSLGIAFVTFSTTEDAQKAIENCDQKTVMDRVITVTYAHPSQNRGSSRRQKLSRPKTKKSMKKHNDNRGSKELSDLKKKASGSGVNSDNGVSSGQRNADHAISRENPPDVDNKSRTRFGRPSGKRGPKGPPVDGIDSKTTIFVAGLSYDTRDEQLIEWFADYNPQKAHVARRPLPRFLIEKLAAKGEQRKGRGFGFITFENEFMQLKAMNEMNEKEICGRKLIVKIAVDKPKAHLMASNDTKDLNNSDAVKD